MVATAAVGAGAGAGAVAGRPTGTPAGLPAAVFCRWMDSQRARCSAAASSASASSCVEEGFKGLEWLDMIEGATHLSLPLHCCYVFEARIGYTKHLCKYLPDVLYPMNKLHDGPVEVVSD
jgi:hypothetical protein